MRIRFKHITILLLFLSVIPLCSAYSLFDYNLGVFNNTNPPNPLFSKSTVTRNFSDNTPDKCSELTVSLTVDIDDVDKYYTIYVIDEKVPSGWIISDPGTGYITDQGHIIWIVITIYAVDTVYTYNVTVPCDALGIYSFDGIYMFKNVILNLTTVHPILGETDVDVQRIVCQNDDDCNDLDDDYCDEDLIKHNEGRCVEYVCTTETTTVTDCNDQNNDYCYGTEIKHDDYTCDNANCVLDETTLVQDCDNQLYCDGQETCVDAACVAGTAIDCSANNILGISTCDNIPDDYHPTWDYRDTFISLCEEEVAGYYCTIGDETITYTCDHDTCGAECDTTHGCTPNSCNETYSDYCDGRKLIEYDDDKIKDSTTVIGTCLNYCESECTCTDCTPDCSAPQTNSYCVKDVCGAECDATHPCADTECDDLDGCVDNDYYDYDDVPNDCLGDCSCETNSCGAPTITYNDPRCTECQIDDDCNSLDDDYCEGDNVMHDEGRCFDYECTTETTTVQDCNDLDNDYCYGTEIKHDDYTCENVNCVLDSTTLIEDCDNQLYCDGEETCVDAACVAGTAPDCDDGVGCTDDSCNEVTDSCENIPNDNYCDDGAWCNGFETCDVILDCQAGIPVDCGDSVDCTIDSCNEQTDSCENIPDNSYCDDGLFCNGAESCNALDGCQAGTPIDCSANDISGIEICDNVPDDYYPTWDYRESFTSVCVEPGTCTTGDETITHTCDYDTCGAECDASNACADTDCDELDGCVGNDYYDYDDVSNDCSCDCICETNVCEAPTDISYNDTRCVECNASEESRACINETHAEVAYQWNYDTCGDSYNETEEDEDCGCDYTCWENDECIEDGIMRQQRDELSGHEYCDADLIREVQNEVCDCEAEEISRECVANVTALVNYSWNYPYCGPDSEYVYDESCLICIPNWICTKYTECTQEGYQYCTQIQDTNNCLECYEGDYSEFTKECDYCGIHGPKIITDDTITVIEGNLVTLDIEMTDPDEDPLTYTISAPVGNDKKWQTKQGDKGTYYVTITVSDGFCIAEKTVKIIVREKPHQGLIFTRTNYEEFLKPGEMQELYVTVENTGNENIEDLKITAFIDTLGIWKKTRKFDLKKGKETTKLIDFIIPYYAPKGRHYIRIVVSNDHIQGL